MKVFAPMSAVSRIVAFGPRTTEEVLRAMEPFVSRDNAMGLKRFAPLYLALPIFLEAWDASDGVERVTLTVVDAERRTREVRVARRARASAAVQSLRAPEWREPTVVPSAHGSRILGAPDPGASGTLLQFNQVADAADVTLTAFASLLRDSLAATRAEYLIVDVRHNSGGNNDLLEPLLQSIAGFAAGSPPRGVYVITGRATFSAAQNFINRLERLVPGVIFAGEPSSSSPNFTGEENPITLPSVGSG